MKLCCAILWLSGCLLHGQTGQDGPRREWPCIAGRAVDPAYLETSESTGGQLFLFQKSEIGQAGLFLTGDFTHPATILRAVGHLSGSREFEFAVDSTVQSLLVLASVQCRGAIRVFRPSGAEMTSANAAQSVDLQTARGVRIDLPEPGRWKLRLEGTGLFVGSVRAKSTMRLAGVEFAEESGGGVRRQPHLGLNHATARVSGEISNVEFQLVTADGAVVSAPEPAEGAAGAFQFTLKPTLERFRIRMSGTDNSGSPVERVFPVLFHTQAGN